MSALSLSRTESPQAFVSSFAPRVRTYQNSLLTPAIQPPNAIAALRTTKRGTTAINYSEDVENDSLVEDSDGPRRPTGLRSLRVNDSHTAVSTGGAGERGIQSMELTSPVDVQGIWREWMGKPKKAMTERQTMTQAQLPLNLVPIRIDLGVNPFQPEAPLPKPNNARELGVDESSPAYKAPDLTPELRIKDAFLWNLHESLMTPDQFAKVFVDELDFPVERRPALALQVSQQIRTQLEEHAAVVMHPLFNPSTTNTSTSNNNNNINNNTTADTRAAPTRAPLSRDMSSTPFAHTPSNALATSTPDANVSAIAHPLPPSSPHNPDDAHRCIISLSVNLMNRLYTDKFEWSLMHPAGFPEIFAKQTCADLALSGEWVPALAHAIYEAVLKLKKDYCENNGSLLAVIGSGMDAWGQIDNESAEVHGDGTLALAEGAGWRFDNEDLGAEWQPRVEVLSKEEIEKREGDRERQIRRLRRETAARATAAGMASMPSDYFGVQAGTGEEERMGRGERSKKKRRFRSLSPTGRETPDFTAAFGGEQGKLTESERPMWQCTHCRIAGNAVWAVRDGPSGPRVSLDDIAIIILQED
jgi:chromatin structure-remodeling complex subunit SFH1